LARSSFKQQAFWDAVPSQTSLSQKKLPGSSRVPVLEPFSLRHTARALSSFSQAGTFASPPSHCQVAAAAQAL
jgi:hypothetical protein